MLKVGYRKEREGKSGACLYCRCKWKKSYIQIRNNEMWNKMLQSLGKLKLNSFVLHGSHKETKCLIGIIKKIQHEVEVEVAIFFS